MKLLVDIGNTRIKWAVLETGSLTSQSFIRSKTGIKGSLNRHWKALKNINSIHVSNVAGNTIAEQLAAWTEQHWQLSPTFVQSEKKRFGVTNSYEQVELLGVDRWCAIIAARQHARQASCVIDCGTAITVDIVTQYGEHQGGMILPGLNLMRTALTNNTSALNDITEESYFKTLAINTQSAIQAGTLYTVTATLERIIDDLKEQFNHKIRFIITGGDAELLKPLIPNTIAHYPDIVLKGLAYYARQTDNSSPHQHHDTKELPSDSIESNDIVKTGSLPA